METQETDRRRSWFLYYNNNTNNKNEEKKRRKTRYTIVAAGDLSHLIPSFYIMQIMGFKNQGCVSFFFLLLI